VAFGLAYLYRQLEAAQTGRNISTIVEKPESIPESQLRPLTKLRNDPEKQRIAWQFVHNCSHSPRRARGRACDSVAGLTTIVATVEMLSITDVEEMR